MLILAASWTLLVAISFCIGSAVLNMTNLGPFERVADRTMLALWMGSLTLAAALLAASLLIPIAPIGSLLVVVALCGSALAVPNTRLALHERIQSMRAWPTAGFVALTLGVAFFSSQQVSLFDTGLYHAGAIEWLARYGSVKGVAQFENRLGFTSSWFALSAAFNWGPLTNRIGTLSGGYALLLASAHLVISTVRLARGEGRHSDWFAVFAYVLVLTWVVRVGMISPSPDIPVLAVAIVVAWSVVILSKDQTEFDQAAKRLLPAQAVPVLISAAAISLKPTAAPLLVVSLLFYLWSSRSAVRLVSVCAISGFLVLPALLANLATSGCPIFPSPLLCDHLPWSMSSDAAAMVQVVGRDFLRWTGPSPPYADSWNWLPHWATSEWLALVLIGYMFAAATVLAIVARRTAAVAAGWVVAIAFVGTIYVLALSPTLRFMFAYLVLPPAYVGAVICSGLRLHPLVLIPPILVALVSLEIATVYDHTNAVTGSAVAFAIIVPAAALALGVGFVWRRQIEMRRRLALPLPGLQYPAVGLIVSLLFATSNYSLVPRTRHPKVTMEGLASLVAPPLLPTLPENQRIQHAVNDIIYVSPPPGLQVCWALIPCTTDGLPSDVHLLDHKRGIAGGFARR